MDGRNAATGVTKAAADKKRWFPVALAEQEIAGYEVEKVNYGAAKVAYDALKAAYEKALDDNVTAREAATMFKKAELVVVPTRPCKPSDLGAYKGKRLAKYSATKLYAW